MTIFLGHSIMDVPGKGWGRFADVYRITKNGDEAA